MADTPHLFSDILTSLATIFQDQVIAQTNRVARTMSLLSWTPFTSKNLAWVIETTGHLAETYAESAAVSNRGSDKVIPAVLSEGAYRSPFGLTARGIAGARTSGNPAALADLVGHEIMNAGRALSAKINLDLFGGSGSDSIIGLATAVDSTGIYATVDPAVDTLWVSQEDANGGVPRPLTLDLMRSHHASLITNCGESPDLIVTTPALYNSYGATMGSQRRYVEQINVSGGTIKLDGGIKALEFDGIPVIADKDCTSGVMYFLNSNYVRGRFLPSSPMTGDGGLPGVRLTGDAFTKQIGYGNSGPMSGGLSSDVIAEGRSGDRLNLFLRAWPQLQVMRRNSCGKIADLT